MEKMREASQREKHEESMVVFWEQPLKKKKQKLEKKKAKNEIFQRGMPERMVDGNS